jgi:hypothetical protein
VRALSVNAAGLGAAGGPLLYGTVLFTPVGVFQPCCGQFCPSADIPLHILGVFSPLRTALLCVDFKFFKISTAIITCMDYTFRLTRVDRVYILICVVPSFQGFSQLRDWWIDHISPD